MFKLLVCDIDGTLVGHDGILIDEIIQLSEGLKDKGILFTLATGRVESLTEQYINQLNIDLPVIFSNGATIIYGEKVIQRKTIPVAGLQAIINKALDLGLSVVYSIEGVETPYNLTNWVESEQINHPNYLEIKPFTEEDWKQLRIDKLMIFDGDRSGIIAEIEDMALQLSDNYTFTRYVNQAIEIVDATATKASAIQVLQNYYEISPEETIVMGDHMNDIEMFAYAGIGIAVQNAIPALKELADYVTHASFGGGVVEVMDLLLTDRLSEVIDK